MPWHAHLVPFGLALLVCGVWFFVPTSTVLGTWALSWASLGEGRVIPLFAHMLAHGGLAHLSINLAALILVSGPLISCLGAPPVAWARYLYLFVGSGVAGGLLFLLINHSGSTSVLGASGAIFGILGAIARVNPVTRETVSVKSGRTWALIRLFITNHIALFALIAIVAFLTKSAPFVAWEAHLGGLLFGFFATPLYLRSPAR